MTTTATSPGVTDAGRRSSALALRCRDNPHDAEAWAELFASMRYLVAQTVNRYHRASTAYDEADLWQEGYAGLVRAVRDFDPARGEISTYAAPWIHQRIGRFRALVSFPIHVPMHVQQRRNAWLWAGRPSDPEMERLDVNCVRTGQLGPTVEPRAQSGDEFDFDGWGPGEFAAVPVHHDPAEAIDVPRRVLRLRAAVDALAREAPRDAEILCRHNGLFGREPEGMRAIAADLGVSWQRVQQLHARAKARLIHLMTETTEVAA